MKLENEPFRIVAMDMRRRSEALRQAQLAMAQQQQNALMAQQRLQNLRYLDPGLSSNVVVREVIDPDFAAAMKELDEEFPGVRF
jgi:hypothetical protein